MPEVITYYVALGFGVSECGIAPSKAIACPNSLSAVMSAEALSRERGYVGALAFSRTGDPATGKYRDANIIRKFGYIPADLRAL